MLTREQKILAIAKANAMSGLDQHQIEDYEDNMRDTIAELFPDWTEKDARIAETEFNRIIASRTKTSPAWRAYVADAVATPPSERTSEQKYAIKTATLLAYFDGEDKTSP